MFDSRNQYWKWRVNGWGFAIVLPHLPDRLQMVVMAWHKMVFVPHGVRQESEKLILIPHHPICTNIYAHVNSITDFHKKSTILP